MSQSNVALAIIAGGAVGIFIMLCFLWVTLLVAIVPLLREIASREPSGYDDGDER